MEQPTLIRILESDTNKKGDLFGRLMADLFVAHGYKQPRLNIHKSGRELDLTANHRLERRRAIAECKATAEPIGGNDLNKFVGALNAEHDDQREVAGYFISLSGFRETAIEQEKQRRHPKIAMLNGSRVVEELVLGRTIVAKDRATEIAGRSCAAHDHLVLDHEAELLAHQRGWIWAIYYTQGKARSHFALIHSDGTPLARALADEVIAADRVCRGSLHNLSCLNPAPAPSGENDARVAEALKAYHQYLLEECGYIQLDGMPTDNDIGSRRLRLENLFVPLHLDVAKQEKDKPMERQPVGDVLSKHFRLALLAAPGGGKSTLLKRLAVVYADPARRGLIDDSLPEREWLPLFFRCRELRSLARGSFAELLEALSQREPVRQYGPVFLSLLDRALLAGHVLLLVDGLDEISDPGDRAAFVCTLRAALQAYPGVAMVVTSREAGFRHVAAHLAPICTHASLSPFDPEDIHRLSVAWHREVVGNSEKVRREAEQLAETIARNDRIGRLAVNPLLLTTLLLVKRWVGSLPTRRAALYGKAVEVLLQTWNTEGHEPILEEEALPQLCYVASAMMINGVQKISRPRLAVLLKEARAALPTELGYVKGPVSQFIERIEERSSLLMMTGYDIEDGQLVEFFEFRHLTFQEFLTAKAMVEGWHPGRKENDTLASVLGPRFTEEKWREVIPLAAVLGGKETEALIQRLTATVGKINPDIPRIGIEPVFLTLLNCVSDEAAARPNTIRAALREIVRNARSIGNFDFNNFAGDLHRLSQSKYGEDFRTEARNAFLTTEDFRNTTLALEESVWWQTIDSEGSTEFAAIAARFNEMLNSSERIVRCEGAVGFMRLCSQLCVQDMQLQDLAAYDNPLKLGGGLLLPLLFSEHLSEQYAASSALVWLGACRVWTPPEDPDVLGRLFALGRHSPDVQVRDRSMLALSNQPIAPRGRRCRSIPYVNFQAWLHLDRKTWGSEEASVLVVAWYLHGLEDHKIAQRTRDLLNGGLIDQHSTGRTLRELLEHLGEKPDPHPKLPVLQFPHIWKMPDPPQETEES